MKDIAKDPLKEPLKRTKESKKQETKTKINYKLVKPTNFNLFEKRPPTIPKKSFNLNATPIDMAPKTPRD